MDDAGDPRSGMGRPSNGPEFTPPSPLSAPSGFPPATAPPRVPQVGLPRSRLPNVLTALAIGLVTVVVAIASLVAYHSDTHIAARPTIPVTIPSPTERADRIEFTTSTGSGELTLLRRKWVDDGYPEPVNGSYLKVEVEISCLSGSIDYAPHNFQAFDHNGELFDLLLDEAEDPALDIGTLEAGERTRGHLAFDIPRGEVTLLMREENDQSVTALRVPV